MKISFLTNVSLAASLLVAFDAMAQDHSQHQAPAPDTSRHTPGHKAKVKPKQPAPQPASATMDHAAMEHATPEPTRTGVDHSAMDHTTPQQEQEEAADHAAMGHTMPRAGDEPLTPVPVLTDADRAAAVRPPSDHPVHDNSVQSFVLFNRLEAFDAEPGTGLEWEGQAWIGTDMNKLWLRSEGERVDGKTENADLEVLYGRSFARWWDAVAGVRHDFQPGGSQDFAAIGVMGVAPYKFEVEATAYIGSSGQTSARLEAEYETLLTHRLILQPLLEVNAYGQNDEGRGIGSGLSRAEAGVRLRYEVTRRFAPYVGVVREWTFGRTADFRRDAGEDINDTRVVAGVRIWF